MIFTIYYYDRYLLPNWSNKNLYLSVLGGRRVVIHALSQELIIKFLLAQGCAGSEGKY